MHTFANTKLALRGLQFTTVLNSTATSLHHVHASMKGSDHLPNKSKFVPSRLSLLLPCNASTGFFPQGAEASLDMEDAGRVGFVNSTTKRFDDRIVKLIHTPEISVSAYDTAWVAMVASPHSTNDEPCFPNCINWLLENQCHDGSWASPHHEQCSFLKKDLIMSTLACILALKRWGVGEDQIIRGIHFIELNFASVTDIKNQVSPIGFDIIFPSMLEYARDLSLNLNLEPSTLANLIHRRELEVTRCNGNESGGMEAYMAYISEGMGKLMDWNSIIVKYQRRNGSLFNSPSATAAACIFSNHHPKDKCLDYLQSALNEFGNAVPAVYPMNLYAQICMVDNLERLGISQYFRKEIQSVLDEAYRCWLEDDEEITMDASTCAMAFRILRKNGYDLNSDKIVKVLEEDCVVPSFICGDLVMRDIHRNLELYRASEIIFPFEPALEKLNQRLKHSLEMEHSLLSGNKQIVGFTNIVEEVKHVLAYPYYATLKRVEDRRNIEQYSSVNSIRILKTSFSSPNFGDKDFLLLSVSDFNRCQQIHREELEELQRWFVDNRLDKLKFAKHHHTMYSVFSAASTIFYPELYEVRMAWATHSVIATVLDSFFDFAGSFEEMKNLIQLVQKWDNVNVSTECLSPEVEILFSVLKSTICDTCDKAFIQQERSVMEHIINIWLDFLNAMLKEAEWARGGPKPTMDEYISNGYVSMALGPIVLPSLYLVGPKISEKMVQHPEYNDLYKLLSTSARLLNDSQSYERELKQGKFNAVTLYTNNCSVDVTEDAAIVEIKNWIESKRRELHKLVVLQGKNSVLPRSCKDLFWHMSEVVHLFYNKDDGYSSEELIKVVNKIIYDPIVMNQV